MMLQFINMEVKKLIICSESWKHQILFNSFIFGIALRNKHIKVNIFSESSLSSNNNKHFLSPFSTYFFPSSQGLGFSFLFFFKSMPFFIQLLPSQTYLGMCAHTHICFSFKHHEGKKPVQQNTGYWTEQCSHVANGIAQFTCAAAEKAAASSSTEATHRLEKTIPVHIGKASNDSNRN